jgi:hypothetical protein
VPAYRSARRFGNDSFDGPCTEFALAPRHDIS